MRISKVEQTKRNADRVSIYIDDKFLCAITKNDVLDLGIYKGMEVDKEFIEDLRRVSIAGKLDERMMRYLSLRPRSVKEFREFLLYRVGIDQALAEEKIAKLESKNYLNDNDFARWWIENRLESGKHSLKKIRAELVAKGIKNDLIESTLRNIPKQDLDDNQTAVAEKVGQKYLNKLNNKDLGDYEKMQKFKSYMLSKGFDYDIIDRLAKKHVRSI